MQSIVRFFLGFATIAMLALLLQAADLPLFSVTRKMVVYDGAPSVQPGIVRAKNGDLVVSFMSRNNLYTVRSKTNSADWDAPRLVASGAFSEVGMTTLRDGVILLPFTQEFVKEPCCQVRRYTTFVYSSKDNGMTWEGDEPINVPMREPIPYGKLIELPGGKLLMPVWGSLRLGERWQVGTFESADHGKTWGHYTRIAFDSKAGCRPDNGFNETSLAQIPDGALVALLRQQRVGSGGGPCDTYTEPAENFYRSVSRDRGNTWSEPERLSLIGTSPALHLLADGTLLLGYRNNPQNPTDNQRYGMAIRVSADRGATWVNELSLQDPKGLSYDAKAQPGYPDFVDLPNGEILVVYHSIEMRDGKRSHYIAANAIRRAVK